MPAATSPHMCHTVCRKPNAKPQAAFHLCYLRSSAPGTICFTSIDPSHHFHQKPPYAVLLWACAALSCTVSLTRTSLSLMPRDAHPRASTYEHPTCLHACRHVHAQYRARACTHIHTLTQAKRQRQRGKELCHTRTIKPSMLAGYTVCFEPAPPAQKGRPWTLRSLSASPPLVPLPRLFSTSFPCQEPPATPIDSD